MSWTVQVEGTPQEVLDYVNRMIAGYTVGSQSRNEFEAAKPHIDALVALNKPETAIVALKAYGHANADSSHVEVTVGVQRVAN